MTQLLRPDTHPELSPLGRSWANAVRSLLATLLLCAFITACGSSAPPAPSGTPEGSVDAPDMVALLTLEDIAAVGGDVSRLEVEVEDVQAAAEAVNPSGNQGIESWQAMKVRRGKSGTVLIFTLIEFQTPEQARARLAQVESGLGFRPMETPVGDASALLSSSSGTGVTFVKGQRVATLQTTTTDLTEPILDAPELELLARMIAERL